MKEGRNPMPDSPRGISRAINFLRNIDDRTIGQVFRQQDFLLEDVIARVRSEYPQLLAEYFSNPAAYSYE